MLAEHADDYKCFHAGGGKRYRFDLAGKNMGSTTESHLLCQLFFHTVVFPWERVCAAQITAGSVRAVSYLDMKDGKRKVGGVKMGRKQEEAGPPLRIVIPEIHHSGLSNLAHHHFVRRYCARTSCRPGCSLGSAVSPLILFQID